MCFLNAPEKSKNNQLQLPSFLFPSCGKVDRLICVARYKNLRKMSGGFEALKAQVSVNLIRNYWATCRNPQRRQNCVFSSKLSI